MPERPQKPWTAEHLPQGFSSSAERREGQLALHQTVSEKDPKLLSATRGIFAASSQPTCGDEAAGQLHLAPPDVDAPGPHVLLSELFPGQRFFLQKQSPICNTIKASTAYLPSVMFPKHKALLNHPS